MTALLALAGTAAAAERPRWELGLGVGAANFPDYRGADERRTLVLPVPYVVYRGERLRADRDGARAELFETEDLELNLSLGGGLPVRTERNAARAGMPDLGWVGEIGPALNVVLARWGGRRNDLQLRLPARAAFALEGGPRGIGAVFSPHLRVSFVDAPWAGGATVRISTGPSFATRAYHRYTYAVDPAYATPTRPAYAPSGGYSAWELGVAVLASRGPWRFAGFAGLDHLQGSVIAASPLVRRKSNASVGFGLAYVFARSEQTVTTRE